MSEQNQKLSKIGRGWRRGLASVFRRWAEALDPTTSRPFRRISFSFVVDSRKQAKMMRRQAKYRDPRDVRDMARLYGQRRCVYRTLELMRAEYRDYFNFEEYDDGRGGIIIRSVLKVRKDG